MYDRIYVPGVEAEGSVLGFIPTNYPAGVVMGEVWSTSYNGVIKFTARVTNIDEGYPEASIPEFFSGMDSMTQATRSLIERGSGLTFPKGA